MSYEKLNEQIQKRREEMFKGDFTEYFYNMITIRWNHLLLFLKTNHLEYNEHSKKQFIIFEQKRISKRVHSYIDYALIILEKGVDGLKGNTNAYKIQGIKEEYHFIPYHQNIYDLYMKEVKIYNHGQTIKHKKRAIKDIILFFQKKNIEYDKLTISIINELSLYYLNLGYSTAKKYHWVLRDFLLFLYNNGYTKINYKNLIEHVRQKNNKKIPVVLEENQIQSIITALPNITPIEKRNKAIVLISIRLGMRIGDVLNLKFENINWIQNEISFIQEKTKIMNQLPLTEEVGNAIIDYVKNGRPKTTLRYIFVTHDEKITKITGSSILNKYLTKVYKISNINKDIKKGTHIFRRSLASELLKNESSLKIISSTLGHVNQSSAKNYLKIDNDKLKVCCLEVPKYE